MAVPWAELRLRETHSPGQDAVFVQCLGLGGGQPQGTVSPRPEALFP